MDIRTFRAATLQEALEQVRETLGPDAAVLHTRQVKRSRMGLFSSSLVEVEASVEMPVASRLVKRAKSMPAVQDLMPAESRTVPTATHADDLLPAGSKASAPPESEVAAQSNAAMTVTIEPKEPQATAQDTKQATERDIDHLNSTPRPQSESANASGSRLPPAVYETLSEMLEAGVEPSVAKELLQAASKLLEVEQLGDGLLLQGRICQLVSKNLRVAEPIVLNPAQQAVIAMVGTTGVGKTTTLAKLATNFQADRNCQVGLITLDTLRPGAVDQLLQYAESLDAALEVVSSANQFLPALHRLKDCDVVLIDTAGRSPNDAEQIGVLQDLLAAAQTTSVQLVVSATSSVGHVQAAIDKFSPLNPTGLIITKLDEAIGFGAWLSILQQCELPVSYVTHGQHVPQDISPANRRRLASLLLGHASQPVS
ncbi:MAG: flagellar biosynthesis protein FlhF [Pirellulaceae bacterium]|nr:flagellar biosynthesis protein FlhF [Pirellulaceae bacterium]